MLYDERFSGIIRVPILDRYFLLDLSGVNVSPGPGRPPTPPSHKNPVREWERDNHERIRDFRILTEKGIRDDRRRDPLRPPPIQPDPDPSRSRPRRVTPDPRSRRPENERDTGRPDRARTTPRAARTATPAIVQTPAVTVTPTVGITPSVPDIDIGYDPGSGGTGGTGGSGGGGGSGY